MRFMFLLVVIVMVTACTGPFLPPLVSPSCERVQGLPLSNQIGQQVDLTEFQAWIVSNYGVGANDISITRWMSDYSLRWKASTVEYSVEVKGNIVTGAIIIFNSSLYRPDIKKVIECLGEPQFYYASYGYAPPTGYMGLDIAILYTDEGIFLSGNKYLRRSTDPNPALDDKFVMYLLELEKPGSKTEVLSQVYSSFTGRDEMPEKFKPWPGSIEAMTIDDLRSE